MFFHTVRSLITAQALLFSANCGVSFSLWNYLKLWHLPSEMVCINYTGLLFYARNNSPCVSTRLHQSKQTVLKTQKKGRKWRWEQEHRRGWDEMIISQFRWIIPQANKSTRILITTLNKVFHTSGVYLKLCHRANCVIMGGPISNLSS